MNKIFDDVKSQVMTTPLSRDVLSKYNKFFDQVNQALKGDNSTKVFIYVDSLGALNTNLLRDDIERVFPHHFKRDFIEFLGGFFDNQELFIDVVTILNDVGLYTLSQNIRLHLFNLLYNSGYFCYTAVDSQSFKDNYLYFKIDLEIISEIVSDGTLKDIDDFLKETMTELYLMNDIDLKYII